MISQELAKAAEILRAGGVVGMPTETVYGLAAAIGSQKGIAEIFATKKRPFFDPLIVHVSSKAMAEKLTTDWSPLANFLAEHFWPGPLTLVLPKAASVNSMITSGLETVGIRMPKHSLALSLIDMVAEPLAAPSANLFGRTSPATAEHVRSEFSANPILVLDGGPCQVGVESTVLSVVRDGEKYTLSILRAGSLTKSELERSLAAQKFQFQFVDSVKPGLAPGQMKHHYMPEIPLVLLRKPMNAAQILQKTQEQIAGMPDLIDGVQIRKPKQFVKAHELVLPLQAELAARELYSALRSASLGGSADILYFLLRPEHLDESWAAVMDRLSKAGSLTID